MQMCTSPTEWNKKLWPSLVARYFVSNQTIFSLLFVSFFPTPRTSSREKKKTKEEERMNQTNKKPISNACAPLNAVHWLIWWASHSVYTCSSVCGNRTVNSEYHGEGCTKWLGHAPTVSRCKASMTNYESFAYTRRDGYTIHAHKCTHLALAQRRESVRIKYLLHPMLHSTFWCRTERTSFYFALLSNYIIFSRANTI